MSGHKFTLTKAIARELERADKVDGTGVFGIEIPDGMVARVTYKTIKGRNRMVKKELVTLEAWTWETHGCSNADEWRHYIDNHFWRDYAAGLRI